MSNGGVFSKFKNKYVITGKILVITALHIGSGEENLDKDAPFVKTSKEGSYYIPGSSFRGYLRSKIERYLSSKNDYIIKDKATKERLSEKSVAKLFGYVENDNIEGLKGNQASKIHIQDMPLITDKKEEKADMQYITTVTRDGIKINKETGITETGSKFDYDVVTMGNIFDVNIVLENIERYELDLILLGLNEIRSEDGDLIGGKTSRGVGRCKLEDLSIKYVESSDKKALEKYIFENKLNKLEKPEITSLEVE